MLKIRNKERFFIKISILSKSDKKVLKFKRLFYAKGTKVCVITCSPPNKPWEHQVILGNPQSQSDFPDVMVGHSGWRGQKKLPTSHQDLLVVVVGGRCQKKPSDKLSGLSGGGGWWCGWWWWWWLVTWLVERGGKLTNES